MAQLPWWTRDSRDYSEKSLEFSFEGHRCLATIFLIVTTGYGCATKPESEGIPPLVFSNKPPLTRVLGKVDVNLSTTEITFEGLTAGELFIEDVWNKSAQGGLIGMGMYWKTIQPLALLMNGCTGKPRRCRNSTAMISSLALLAMVAAAIPAGIVGGVVGGTQARYSESLANDLKQSLIDAVAKSNDELRSAIVSSSRALVFRNTREQVGGQSWTTQAFSNLNMNSVVEIRPRSIRPIIGVDSRDQPDKTEEVDSVIDARISEVTITGDDAWGTSNLKLLVRAGVNTYRADDSLLLDERRYECVSVPRSVKFWSRDSYRNVRGEIVECNQLLGRQIARDLLMPTVETIGK